MLVFQGSIRSNNQLKKGVNIQNNIQKIISKEILQKIFNFFLPHQNSFTIIKQQLFHENLSLALQQSTN